MNFCDLLSFLINNSCGIKARRKSWIDKSCFIERQFNVNAGSRIMIGHVGFGACVFDEYRPNSKDMLANDWEIINES